MGAIFMPGADCRVTSQTVMTEATYKHVSGIQWKNGHTTRFAAALGDPNLVAGWDDTAGCWVLAYLRPRTIVSKFGHTERAHRETVPVVFQNLVDPDTGKPLSILDPRIIPALFQADTYRHGSQVEAMIQATEDESAKKAAARRENARDQAKELYPLFKKFADEVGFSRPGREGEAGSRKFHYQGCLEKRG